MEDHLAVGVGEFASHSGRDSGPERTWGHGGSFGDDRAGGDDGAFADVAVVEYARADADEHGVLDDAAVDGGVVSDGDQLADEDGIEIALAVEDGAILNVGLSADTDGVYVAAEDGIHPDARVRTEGDVADELSGGIDVTALGDGR